MLLGRRHIIGLILFQIIFTYNLWAGDLIQYLSPIPGAKYVSVHTSLTIRFYDKWQNILDHSLLSFTVYGEKSGRHEGDFNLLDDGITCIFKPDVAFYKDETVSIQISSHIPGYEQLISYKFTTSKLDNYNNELLNYQKKEYEEQVSTFQYESYSALTVINGVSVPSGFPEVIIDTVQTTAPGRLFLTTQGGIPYFMILENDGTPYFYQRLTDFTRDFKVQPTGTLTRLERGEVGGYVEMDSNFQIIDTLKCGNGYGTDQHEAQVLPNGNYLLIAIGVQQIPMDSIIAGGNPEARVIGNHVQELDREGNVVFEWRSWDHFNILDALGVKFSDILIDYVHMNSIAVDYDGHIVISSRHLSEVTKINRQTGEIIWRLGGKNNQFEFVNDEDSISYQHDVRPVPGKENHYTIFDNGNLKATRYSRAIEFMIDTTEMTATKVWEYRHSPDWYAYAMGNAQRLPNGNTVINWSGNPNPVFSEVSSDGEILYKLRFGSGIGCYRSFRFDWSGISKSPYLILENYDDRVSLIFNKFGDPDVMDYIIYAGLEPNPITPLDTTSQTWIDLTDFKYNERYYFRVTARNYIGEESDFSNEENTQINFINPGDNMILNGDFSDGDNFWELDTSGNAYASGSVDNGIYHLTIDTSGTSELNVQLLQAEISLVQGKKYILEFDAYADIRRAMEVNLEKAISPFDNYSRIGFILIEETMKHYNFEFEMTDPSDFEAKLVFNCGREDADLHFDNISLKEDITSEIENENFQVPEKYNLFQNYPNPFNPNTVIQYAVPQSSYIKMWIYNILGQKVEELINSHHDPGVHQVSFNSSNISSGIYYYRMEAMTLNGKVIYNEARKMMVLK